MSNTVTIEQVGDSLTRAIAQLATMGGPIEIIRNGQAVAHLLPSDRHDWEARAEEVTALRLMEVAELSGAFEWLSDEPDLYSVDDLKVRYR